MMNRTSSGGLRPVRRDRLIQEERHDTYRSKGKLREPTVCPGCGAIYHAGMWQWVTAPEQAHQQNHVQRASGSRTTIRLGFVTLGGGFLDDHRDDILNLARNEEARGNKKHAVERIMKIDTRTVGLLITTTDIHLARRIGEAVHHAYGGELKYHYEDNEHRLRVNLARERT